MRIALAVLPIFAASFLLAQQIKPTALPFESVPPNTSPQEGIAFANTGTTQLTLAVSVSGPPFAIADNRCANGVKPGTHCNVYLTYTAVGVGDTDTGTLTFDYGEGIVTAPLTGHGVSAIPTYVKMARHTCLMLNLGGGFSMTAKVWSLDKYYAPPVGEQVHASCTNGQENVDLGAATLTLCKGRGCPSGPYAQAPFGITPDQTGNWSCQVTYDGDGVLAGGTGAVNFQVVDGGGHCH